MFKIAVIPGDGIGVEVVEQAVKVLKVVSKKYDVNFQMEEGAMGVAKMLGAAACLGPLKALRNIAEADAINIFDLNDAAQNAF